MRNAIRYPNPTPDALSDDGEMAIEEMKPNIPR